MPYEAPFTEDQGRAARNSDYSRQLSRLAAGRRGDAAGLFLRRARLPRAMTTQKAQICAVAGLSELSP
ncbi:MAG: hypothetical protein ACM3ML_30055 [Micromonosporaceae bacterium]